MSTQRSLPTSYVRISKWLASVSNVAAPGGTPAMNGQLPVVPSAKPGVLAAALSRALAATWRTLLLPYTISLQGLAWSSALLIHIFTLLGAPPQGYVPQSKMRELDSIIDHMHTREDIYRKTIKELQEELESKDHDRRRALRRLKSTKAELEVLHQQLAEMQEQYSRTGGYGRDGSGSSGIHAGMAAAAGGPWAAPASAVGAAQLHRTPLHTTIVLLLALVWWFYQQECHAIQRKLVFAVLFPVLWSYVTMLLSKRPVAHPVLLYSTAWGLIGFVGAYKFSQLT